MTTKTVQYTTYLDALLFSKLEAIAKADDRTVSYLIQKAAMELVGKQENVVKWRQIDIEEQLGRPLSEKGAATMKRMDARVARVAERARKK